MRKPLPVLAVGLLLVAALQLHALSESELLGEWELTSYLAIRETADGSYHLVIGEEQRSAEYPLLRRVRFLSDGICSVTLASPSGGTEEIAALFRKQTVEGREYIRLSLGGDEQIELTITAIVPEVTSTQFFLSTTQGRGLYAEYFYDTFGSMSRTGG